MLDRLADVTWRRPRLILAIVAVAAVGAGFFAHDVEHRLKAAGFTDSASESEQATALLRKSLGYDPNPGLVVVLRPRGGGALDTGERAVRREVARLAAALAETRHVGKVVNPLRGDGAAGLIAVDGRSLVITGHLSTADVEDAGGVAAEDAAARLHSKLLRVSIGGFAPSFNDVNDQTRRDLTNAELIAFPVLAVILVLVFRGLLAAAIPLLIGGLSIVGALLVLRIMSAFVDTSLFALNIATALSLGLAVDYALLLVSRYREELARDGPSREAHRRTVLGAGRAAAFSGLTVAVAMAPLLVFPQRFLYSLGAAGAAVGILSAVVTLLVVPSILAIAGERINRFSVRRAPAATGGSERWRRLMRSVLARPALVAVLSGGILLAAASPLLGTKLTGPSTEIVPPGLPSYEPNAYVERHYSRAVAEAITVTVRGSVDRPDLARLRRRIAATPGVAGGTPFVRAGERVAFANFAPANPALADRSLDAVMTIREAPAPARAEMLVSGNTARFIDQKESLAAYLPLVIALVAGSTLVLMFLLTGSVLLPLKTLLMNTLTLGATLGILVLGFQVGLLDLPFDYNGPDAIEVTSLVFLFTVTFGLATDYAVLVMARIKESHDAGATNDEAIAAGIVRTGPVITAAAAMIAVVFLAFAVSPIFFMKQIAVGIAVGVLIDATIVRALLVPSLMKLLGEWNWWAPRPLRRLHRRLGFSEA